MIVSQCTFYNVFVYIMIVSVFVFCSIGNTSRIDFSPFCGNFEVKAIPFWYRLLEPMTEQIGYQVLIQTLR